MIQSIRDKIYQRDKKNINKIKRISPIFYNKEQIKNIQTKIIKNASEIILNKVD